MLQEISTEKRNSTCALLFIEYFCCLQVLTEEFSLYIGVMYSVSLRKLKEPTV